MTKNFLKSLIILMLILLSLCGMCIFWLKTETGLRLTIATFARIAKGNIVNQKLHGCLLGPIDIEQFHFSSPKVTLRFNKAHVDWQLKDLFFGKFNVTKVWIDQLQIITNSQQIKQSSSKSINFNKADLITHLNLEKLEITNSSWQQDKKPPIKIKNIMLQIHANKNKSAILEGKFSTIDIEILVTGTFKKQWDLSWKINIINLKSLSQDISGSMYSQGKITGKLNRPEINANTEIKDFKYSNMEPIILPSRLAINWSCKIRANGIIYQGKVLANNGVLNFNGKTSSSLEQSKIFINGNNFLLLNIREYIIFVSPHLILETNNQQLMLTGKIFIPHATIKPSYFNYDTLSPSEITYIDKTKERESQNLHLHTTIQLGLGEDVVVKTMGLNGKAHGQLEITDESGKDTTATGAIYLKDASFNIYGQKLKITKAYFHFFGNPITNPEVDAEVIRNLKASSISKTGIDNDLIVGIKMKGPLDTAKTELFSKPSGLSEVEILSYLIFGQSSEQIAKDRAQLLLQTAYTLSFKETGKAESLTATIKNKFSLSEFGLTESTKPGKFSITSPTFMLGKYLTPKVYVDYNIGLINPINIFRINFYINKYWTLRNESSSLGNSIDLFYTLEFN